MPYIADKEMSSICYIWHTGREANVSDPRVHRSKKYKTWYRTLSEKDRGIVDTRVDTYIEKGTLVSSKSLDSNFGLYEFKWMSG